MFFGIIKVIFILFIIVFALLCVVYVGGMALAVVLSTINTILDIPVIGVIIVPAVASLFGPIGLIIGLLIDAYYIYSKIYRR